MMQGFGRGFGHEYYRGFGIGGMMLIMVLLVVLIGVVLYFALRNRNVGNRFSGNYVDNSRRAMEILNEKLALGEITEEEYIKRKNLINS